MTRTTNSRICVLPVILVLLAIRMMFYTLEYIPFTNWMLTNPCIYVFAYNVVQMMSENILFQYDRTIRAHREDREDAHLGHINYALSKVVDSIFMEYVYNQFSALRFSNTSECFPMCLCEDVEHVVGVCVCVCLIRHSLDSHFAWMQQA